MKKIVYLFGFILFFYLIISSDLSALWQALKELPPFLLIFLVLLQFATQLLIGFQWHGLVSDSGHTVSLQSLLILHMKGSVVDGITPGAKIGGEAYRTLALSETLQCSKTEALSIVILQKLFSTIGILSLSLVSLVYLIFSTHFIQNDLLTYGLVGSSLFLLIVSLTLVFKSRKQPTKKEDSHRLLKSIQHFRGVFSTYTSLVASNKKRLTYHFVIAFVIWLLFPLKLLLIVRVFDTNASVIAIFVATFAAYLIGSLPLSPGGLGPFEVTMTTLLVLLTSVNSATALTIATVFRVVTFWMVLAGSSIILLLTTKNPFQRSWTHVS